MNDVLLKLEIFEGPLDLLLHLITKNKIDIRDIPITQVTAQYMEYLSAMKELDLDIASEFVVMAAQLIYIKSKMLLPSAAEEAEDPRAELVEKLLEYQQYKNTLDFFKEQNRQGSLIFTKDTEPLGFAPEYVYTNTTMEEMVLSIREMLKRLDRQEPPPKAPFEKLLKRQVFSVSEKIAYVEQILQSKKKVGFLLLFEGHQYKEEVIATFLAVLELLKEKKAKTLRQNNKIYILAR